MKLILAKVYTTLSYLGFSYGYERFLSVSNNFICMCSTCRIQTKIAVNSFLLIKFLGFAKISHEEKIPKKFVFPDRSQFLWRTKYIIKYLYSWRTLKFFSGFVFFKLCCPHTNRCITSLWQGLACILVLTETEPPLFSSKD